MWAGALLMRQFLCSSRSPQMLHIMLCLHHGGRLPPGVSLQTGLPIIFCATRVPGLLTILVPEYPRSTGNRYPGTLQIAEKVIPEIPVEYPGKNYLGAPAYLPPTLKKRVFCTFCYPLGTRRMENSYPGTRDPLKIDTRVPTKLWKKWYPRRYPLGTRVKTTQDCKLSRESLYYCPTG